MSKFGLVNDLSILLAGRRLLWAPQEPASGTPRVATAGVHLRNAPLASVVVDLREDVARRTDRIRVEAFDELATYTLTVDGAAVSVVEPSDVDALLAEWADEANADPGISAKLTASVEDGALVLRGRPDVFYAVGLAATGEAVLSLQGEPTFATVRLWARSRQADGQPSPGWRALGEAFEVGTGGWEDLVRVSGRDRLFVELVAADAPSADSVAAPHTATYLPARIRVGPAIMEAVT